MYKVITIALLVFTLGSCINPQRVLNRRIDRIEQYSRKHNLTTSDTITVRDTVTITVPEIHTDTILEKQKIGDTVYIEKDRLKIKYVQLEGEKVYIEGECEEVIIEKAVEIKVPVEKIKYVKNPFKPWWVWLWLLAIPLIPAIYKVLRKNW